MTDQVILGVLSPFLGSWYYGGILESIARSAHQANASVVAVQTLAAGTDQIEVGEPPDPGYPLAWDRVDGLIVVVDAVAPRYLAAFQATGKPMVAISREYPELGVPVVLPDNQTGTREAVSHLIEHGHRRIAFAGYLGCTDVQERLAAYQTVLAEHGLGAGPSLLFDIDDNQQSGGEQAALAMLADGLRSTAVIAATDANALGIISVLRKAGLRLPQDQAVIGFDDLPGTAFSVPRLSTVRQPVDTVGEVAVAVLLDRLAADRAGAGGPVSAGGRTALVRHFVPTSLVTRESCGCSDVLVPPADSWTLVRRQFDNGVYLQAALGMQYEVGMDLLRSHERNPRQLEWLARTTAIAGCLGLWERNDATAPDDAIDADRTLRIVGTYFDAGAPAGAPAGGSALVSARDFPSRRLLAIARDDPSSMVLVLPVKTGDMDWGLLAVVDSVEKRVPTGREPINQWAALLAVALDHQAVLAALRTQEERLRVAAMYDHLTGLPNRALFLDRLRQAIAHRRRDPDLAFAVLFLDLDDFKVINDSLGHSIGDTLLVRVAERIRSVLRECDTAARFGGDEFLILLDRLQSPFTPSAVADRLHSALSRPVDIGTHRVMVTVSIGIALSEEHYIDANDMLRDADIAMYSAKSRGKGTHSVFHRVETSAE